MKLIGIVVKTLLFIPLLILSCEAESPDSDRIINKEIPTSEEPDEEETPPLEYIEIPDPNFKHALVNTNSVDLNNDKIGDIDLDSNDDGEIDKTELNNIESLILQFNYYDIKRAVDLSGIAYFKDLKTLIVSSSELEGFTENLSSTPISYDFTTLSKLEYLRVDNLSSEYCQTIDLTGLNNLSKAELWSNRPGFLSDSREWDDLKYFIELKMNGCSSLTDLSLINSFLKLDLCQVPTLKDLNMRYLEGGEPEVFDFHCLTQLENLDIAENNIKSLILKNSSVLNSIDVSYIGSASEYSNYPFVEYVCIDDFPEEYEQISTLIDDDTVVTTDCTF